MSYSGNLLVENRNGLIVNAMAWEANGTAERDTALEMSEDAYVGPRQHLLLMGCLFLGGIIIAFAPDAVLGLHYQCLLSRVTGVRCPFCGMTRDFILMSKGLLPRNNPGSLFVALAAYLGYPLWILAATICGRSSLLISREKALRVLTVVMVVLLVCNNLVR